MPSEFCFKHIIHHSSSPGLSGRSDFPAGKGKLDRSHEAGDHDEKEIV
jgi:hypothetical protein